MQQSQKNLVKEYLLADSGNLQILEDALAAKLKTKKGRQDWFKHCHKDWLDKMSVLDRAEWDKRDREIEIEVAKQGYSSALNCTMLVLVAALLFSAIIISTLKI